MKDKKDLSTTEEVVVAKNSEEKMPTWMKVAAGLGIVVIVLSVGVIAYLLSTKMNQNREIVTAPEQDIQKDRITLLLEEVENELTLLDTENAFDAFGDSELAVSEEEEELDSAISDIDTLLEDLNNDLKELEKERF